jgi:serine/threonine protein kinase
MMVGLEHAHNNGIAHRDMKPENILLDSQFTLKLADFGLQGPMEGRDGSGILQTRVGSSSYMAPEVNLRMDYRGDTADIFSCGVILFIMVSKSPPFCEALPNDPHYRIIAAKKPEIFWRVHFKNHPGGVDFVSEEFRDLVTRMLSLEPVGRPTINEIMQHPWLNGPTMTKDQVI